MSLQSKNTAETVVCYFDFLSRLALSETISSAVVTVTVVSGTDGTPENLLNGLATVEASKVLQSITGGTAGVVYNLSCAITTSTSQILVMNQLLAVTSTNPF